MSNAQRALGGVSLNATKIAGQTAQRNYFTAGDYLVEIVGLKLVLRRKQKDYMFIAETRILESEGPQAKKPGLCSWTMKMGLDAAPANIKELLVAASGIDPSNVEAIEAAGEDWDANYEMALSDEQPYAGQRLRIHAYNVVDDAGATKYVRCRFQPAE